MPPPIRRSFGAIPEKAPGVPGAVEEPGLAPPDAAASRGPPAAVCPGVPGGADGPGATTDATSPVPAGGAGMAAW